MTKWEVLKAFIQGSLFALAVMLLSVIVTEIAYGDQISCVTTGGTTVCSDGTSIISSGDTTIINPGREEEEKENTRKEATTCVRTKSTIICF